MGSPRVDLATLVELKRLLIDTATVADFQGDIGVVRENHHDLSQIAGKVLRPTDEPVVRHQEIGGTGRA